MAKEDQAARKARAAALREEIRKLRQGSRPPSKPANPREFVEQASKPPRRRSRPDGESR